MLSGLRIPLLALGAAMAFVLSPARAQTAADNAGKWGLLGSWAPDCGAAPSAQNMHLRYAREGGSLIFERDDGSFRDSNNILRAIPAPDGALAITINFEKFSAIRTNLMVRGTDGRIRVMSNYDDKGSYSVKDGKLVHSGAATPWHSRCR